MTAGEHAAEDTVVHTAAQEQALDAHTRAVSASDAQTAAAAVAGAPQDVGEWGPVVDWPVVAVHVALLPNGKVLAYDSIGDNATETYPVQDTRAATVWDPVTGAQTAVTLATGYNIFCSGLAHLSTDACSSPGATWISSSMASSRPTCFDPYRTCGAAARTWRPGAGIRRSPR